MHITATMNLDLWVLYFGVCVLFLAPVVLADRIRSRRTWNLIAVGIPFGTTYVYDDEQRMWIKTN